MSIMQAETTPRLAVTATSRNFDGKPLAATMRSMAADDAITGAGTGNPIGRRANAVTMNKHMVCAQFTSLAL